MRAIIVRKCPWRGIAWIVVALALWGIAKPAAAQPGTVTTCVARGAELSTFTMPVGDTAAFQDSVRRAEPLSRAEYAGTQPWFIANERVGLPGESVGKYGLPRFVDARQLRRVGEHRGVGIYVDRTAWWRVQAFYLPVRAGCEFQPYTPSHWGISCSSLGCPFATQPPPPGAVCRLRGDELVWAEDGEPAEAAARFAESRRWYVADRPVTFQGHTFGRIDLPRTLPPGTVHRIGEIDGVGVYVGLDSEAADRAWGFYVPVRAGCEFQLYEDETMYAGVRGE